MGSGASSSVAEAVQKSTLDELTATLANLPQEDRAKVLEAMSGSDQRIALESPIELCSGSLSISVVGINGDDICDLSVGNAPTVLELKALIAIKTGISACQQRLMIGGRLLDEQGAVLEGPSTDTVQVTLICLTPSEEVRIKGGQGQSVSVNDEGIIQPGPSFMWRMAKISDNEYTFQAAEGPHEGKYISALGGAAFSSGSNLILSGMADAWSVDTKPANTFYNWAQVGPFAMGIRDSTRTVSHNGVEGMNAYWRWQSKSYHLAPKTGIQFQGDEAFFISFAKSGNAAVDRHDADA